MLEGRRRSKLGLFRAFSLFGQEYHTSSANQVFSHPCSKTTKRAFEEMGSG